jgi:hypothetical protein
MTLRRGYTGGNKCQVTDLCHQNNKSPIEWIVELASSLYDNRVSALSHNNFASIERACIRRSLPWATTMYCTALCDLFCSHENIYAL